MATRRTRTCAAARAPQGDRSGRTKCTPLKEGRRKKSQHVSSVSAAYSCRVFAWRFGLRRRTARGGLPRGAMGDRRHAHLSEEEIAECAAAHASLAREASHSLLSERRARSTRPPCAYLRFREIFNLVDLDKGGTISKEELKQLMNTLGLKPSQASTAHSPSARRTATRADAQGRAARAGGAQPDGGRDRCGQQRRD